MTTAAILQFFLLLFEAVAVCGLLLWFFRLRTRFGYSLLYITLGSFQPLQSLMASTLYIQLTPGLVVSPGSTILFTATLFAVLLVYIREDAAEARSLIVGVLAANITLSLLLKLASMQIDSGLVIGAANANDHFQFWNARAFVIGTCTMVIDVILIIVLYEFFYRIFPRLLFARILGAMLVVVCVDTGIFVTASFLGQDIFVDVLKSSIIGKSFVVVVYSTMLTVYLLLFRQPQGEGSEAENQGRDIFHILTYKQKFDLLRHEASRDSLSGLHNRKFFDDNLFRELKRASRLDHKLNLVLIDIDHFKQVNDTYGHQIGDQAIKTLADSMQGAFRSADILCRYGGEEFAVIMPDSSIEAAFDATQRLQKAFADACATGNLPCKEPLTFTAGIANYPADGATPAELIKIADGRLYKGKHRGRNRVMFDTVRMRAFKLP